MTLMRSVSIIDLYVVKRRYINYRMYVEFSDVTVLTNTHKDNNSECSDIRHKDYIQSCQNIWS
jgi:hypothetical protein